LDTFRTFPNEDKVEVIEWLVKNQDFLYAFEDYGLSKLMGKTVSLEEALKHFTTHASDVKSGI